MRLLLFAVFLGISVKVQAAGFNVAGVDFDTVYAATPCQGYAGPDGSAVVEQGKVSSLCIDPTKTDSWQNSTVKIWFPARQLPKGFSNPSYIQFADGEPRILFLGFDGVDANDVALTTLEEQFGPPMAKELLRKPAGRDWPAFYATEAIWRSSDYEVTLTVPKKQQGWAVIVGPASIKERLNRAKTKDIHLVAR